MAQRVTGAENSRERYDGEPVDDGDWRGIQVAHSPTQGPRRGAGGSPQLIPKIFLAKNQPSAWKKSCEGGRPIPPPHTFKLRGKKELGKETWTQKWVFELGPASVWAEKNKEIQNNID